METDLVCEGIKFMVLGMGIVFTFLAILIVVINITSKIVRRLFPEQYVVQQQTIGVQKKEKKKIVAAIVAAIMEDKKRNRN